MSTQDLGGVLLSVVAFGLVIEYLTGRSAKDWLKNDDVLTRRDSLCASRTATRADQPKG